ncbi:uncharacterized protein LOC132951473 [Metopolophium dirhodum]|uniref:uncharacterized protein LOC132951079 n=1 Tax=Metopolophium dirhodum TaxID=44670 RepID=UPI00298F8990|nr:uncharacterized protein LOC132951079 [Metopolophium dirhodum]XP_060878759.1 uncharacterized protein LOC132951079 [Metopolophium dirhodum]XP_060879281.1 uncharacterized protein LOC132951473 [Metopolophium dirhodum]
MSKSAIHTFVYKGRHEIKEKLGFCSSPKIDPPEAIFNSSTEYGSSDENSSSNLDFPRRKFVVTFSSEEWKKIKPDDVQYRLHDKKRPSQSFKTYYALTKNQWTPILAEHFWVHTQLSCCLSFRKANVHPHGTNFVTVFGRCSVCSSCFKGIISEKPLDNEKVLMQCTYTGNFDMLHEPNKKRRLLGTAKEKVITAIVQKNMSSATHRETEAVRLMKTGDFSP